MHPKTNVAPASSRWAFGVLGCTLSNRVAFIAGVLFAVHPLQVEVVAWINGRMMLLSTLCMLLTLLAVEASLRTHRIRWAGLTLLCAAACLMSKVRVELPLLLLIVPLARRCRPGARFALLWFASAALTAFFTWLNYRATEEAGMFEGAVRNLHGPGIVRATRSLAWYFEHFLWPAGLASWYPAPITVRLGELATLRAACVVVPVLAIAAWSAKRSRAAGLGFAWFFLAIATTVQLVPTRNTLAADRYMYLPIIGLLWVTALALSTGYERCTRRSRSRGVRAASAIIAVTVVVALLAQSWHTASYYDDQVKKSERIAHLFPTTPHVWERVAWAYHRDNQFDEAITAAKHEFNLDDINAQADAHEVIGASLLEMKRYDDAIAAFQRAIELDPKNAAARHRMGRVFEELGRIDEALDFYRQAVAMAPLKNPWLIHLASVYRRRGNSDPARKLYEQAWSNNPYEVPAILGLAELEIAQGTPQSYENAEQRLTQLLQWMPENTTAWVDRGVVAHAQGSTQQAIDAYRRALELHPQGATAALNLAQILEQVGQVTDAWPLYETAALQGLPSLDQLLVVHDFFLRQGAFQRSVLLWTDELRRFPDVEPFLLMSSEPRASARAEMRPPTANDRLPHRYKIPGSALEPLSPLGGEGRVRGFQDSFLTDARAMLAWSMALSGNIDNAATALEAVNDKQASTPHGLAAQVFIALAQDRYENAATTLDRLLRLGEAGAPARQRLLRALEIFDRQKPDVAWTYCLTARLLLANNQPAPARLFTDLCAKQCAQQDCVTYAEWLRVQTP